MKDIRVLIPDEFYTILEFRQEDLPGIAVINTTLKNFEQKKVFSWNLSIIIDLENLIDNGMPSQTERDIIDPFGDALDKLIKGPDIEKPNALFFGRVTWNKTRQLIWRVYDPEIADPILKKIIEEKSFPRQFDYRMEQDFDWKLTEWYLKDYDKKTTSTAANSTLPKARRSWFKKLFGSE